jgi:hypothetical protein
VQRRIALAQMAQKIIHRLGDYSRLHFAFALG